MVLEHAMASMNEIKDGLVIFAQYELGGECDFEHDICYAGTIPPKTMHKMHEERLEEAGWHWDATLPRWWHEA